jgi:predicted Zn-dependent protease
MKLKRCVLAVTLCLCAGVGVAAPAEVVVQDGIQVKPIPQYYKLASKEKIDRESKMQYTGMLSQAAQAGALVPDNHPQVKRLRAIAARMMPYASRWNPDAAQWRWEVNLFNSKQVNAFCMPGGRIGFYSGILTTLQLSDDEVAAVMGHEVAHALREHGRGQMVKSTGTSLAARLLGAGASAWFGIDPRVTDTIAQAGSQMISLKFSRDDEREADLIGLDLAARAGFDPRAGVVLWQKMAAHNQGMPLAWLSTHPGGPERVTIMNQHMNVLLPLYARSKGTTAAKLPPYRASLASAR